MSLSTIKSQFSNLPQLNKILQKSAYQLNWNPISNPLIQGSTNHRPPSEYLEEIADILFQFDVAITCMQQYYDAIKLSDTESYQNLSSSFNISDEVVDAVNEFLIKSCIFVNS